MKKELKTSYLTKLGVFSSMLFVTATAVYLYSPTFGSNAEERASVHISANVNLVASLSLDVNELVFDVVPTADGIFESKAIAISSNTNSTGGYELYFSAEDDNTDMVHEDENVTDRIASDFSGIVTGSTMPANKWGYSLDDENFSPIPTVSSQRTIVNIEHFPEANEKDTTVYIGTKISNTLHSGAYSKNLMFSVLAHESAPSVVGIHSITTMQEMTPAICAATTTPATSATQFDWDGSHHDDDTYVPRTKLTDTRDNNTYLISKLADGNCWMSQSLALDLTANTAIVTSNNDGTTGTATPNNTTQTTTGTAWAQADNNWRSYHPQSSESYYQSGITKSSSPSGSGDAYNWEKAGNYYNWYAATAGTGTSSMTSAEAGSSICPKGWRLPSKTGSKSFINLVTTTYNIPTNTAAGSDTLRAAPLNFNLSGYYYYYNAAMDRQGSFGYYWSSLAYPTATYAYALPFDTSAIYPQNNGDYKGYGFSVRCVAI